MNSPESRFNHDELDEASIIIDAAESIEIVIASGAPALPQGRIRESAWARDFYGDLRDEIASRVIDDSSLVEISKRGQSVTIGELVEAQSAVVTRYSKTTSPDPVSQRGVCITWGYEPLEDDQIRFFQTLIQVGSQTESWNEIPIVDMPQVVAEFKTTEIVADNSQEFGLQREIPGWAKLAGGVGVTAVTAATLAIGTKFAYGKLKNR